MKNLTLINGIFTPEEMKEVVINMISNKINFHHLKNLRNLEREGIEDQNSKKRLDELHQLKKEIIEMNLDENKCVKLKSTIEIEVVETIEN
ncbi:MAG: hypothetical protein FGM14_14590 [Flavobacteriales bacterium]|nr:hypothetical protein [Flavobacteriales bacterium]